MIRVIKFLVCGAIVLGTQGAKAQNVDEERMNRDIAVAENILNTLIKQEFDKRNFFPVEVRGSYRSGYGVTFSIPTEIFPMMWSGQNDFVMLDGTPGAFSYSYSWSDDDDENLQELKTPEAVVRKDKEKAAVEKQKAEKEMKEADKQMKSSEKEMKEAQKGMEKAEVEAMRSEQMRGRVGGMGGTRVYRVNRNTDSLRAVSNAKLIQAAKNFLADYGDLLSLAPSEKIVITNLGENQRRYNYDNEKRSVVTVEAFKSDIAQVRQGKISRDQFLSKIKVVNTESSGKVEPDLELLTSIFNRLYRSDLSQTFFLSNNPYYERLNDFGAIVYLEVFSSNQVADGLYNMPTLDLRGVDQAARDKKVKELYPVFEKDLKDNILEYGRTVKSLKDNEQLVFNVKLTRCKGCDIPADVEMSVNSSVLKDYNSGKLEKSAALAKITMKKGANQ